MDLFHRSITQPPLRIGDLDLRCYSRKSRSIILNLCERDYKRIKMEKTCLRDEVSKNLHCLRECMKNKLTCSSEFNKRSYLTKLKGPYFNLVRQCGAVYLSMRSMHNVWKRNLNACKEVVCVVSSQITTWQLSKREHIRLHRATSTLLRQISKPYFFPTIYGS